MSTGDIIIEKNKKDIVIESKTVAQVGEIVVNTRITESGDARITESGDTRVTE